MHKHSTHWNGWQAETLKRDGLINHTLPIHFAIDKKKGKGYNPFISDFLGDLNAL